MPQYLYRIQLNPRLHQTEAWLKEDNQAVSDHFNYLVKLKDTGQLILAGRTQTELSTTFGLVIFNANDEVEALSIMNQDPSVIAGVMIPQLYPYSVALICETNAKER